MRTLYFDAFSGASGDMILGALVDLGGDFPGLCKGLSSLSRGRFSFQRRKVVSKNLAATKIDVLLEVEDEQERNFKEISAIIRRSSIPEPVKARSLDIFRRLCQAEARVHGMSFDRVHLHEAGALDAIADICGAAWLLHDLAPERIVCSPLNVGSGTLECRHGTYPVPGPATAQLLKGVPVYSQGAPGERVTPTGAAILTTVADEFGPLPPMHPEAIGGGAGDREFSDRPNVLRAILGQTVEGEIAAPSTKLARGTSLTKPGTAQRDFEGPNAAIGRAGQVMVLEATIDDMNPQNYGHVMERALSAGALEVYFTPIFMKKERPATLLTVLLEPDALATLARVVFQETTTIGFRYRLESRRELDRTMARVATRFGPVRVKVSSAGGTVYQVQPEYEDCRKLALASNVPLKEVQRMALAAWSETGREAGSNGPGAAGPPVRSASARRATRTSSRSSKSSGSSKLSKSGKSSRSGRRRARG